MKIACAFPDLWWAVSCHEAASFSPAPWKESRLSPVAGENHQPSSNCLWPAKKQTLVIASIQTGFCNSLHKKLTVRNKCVVAISTPLQCKVICKITFLLWVFSVIVLYNRLQIIGKNTRWVKQPNHPDVSFYIPSQSFCYGMVCSRSYDWCVITYPPLGGRQWLL